MVHRREGVGLGGRGDGGDGAGGEALGTGVGADTRYTVLVLVADSQAPLWHSVERSQVQSHLSNTGSAAHKMVTDKHLMLMTKTKRICYELCDINNNIKIPYRLCSFCGRVHYPQRNVMIRMSVMLAQIYKSTQSLSQLHSCVQYQTLVSQEDKRKQQLPTADTH